MVFSPAVSTLICSCLDGSPLGVAGVALGLLVVPRIWWLVILACMGVLLGAPVLVAPALAGTKASGTAASGTAASRGAKRLMNELRMIGSLRNNSAASNNHAPSGGPKRRCGGFNRAILLFPGRCPGRTGPASGC